ncbi:MAG: hypothetical protein HFJ23_00930 [Clostridia bacterium]|nr:hypothetical protein [Clostridia bacterium]
MDIPQLSQLMVTNQEHILNINKTLHLHGQIPHIGMEQWQVMAVGITALSIILSGYGQNYTPEDLRNLYSPVLKSNNISKELDNSFGISNTDFFFDSVHLSSENLIKHLKTNKPILICVWNKPTINRWTTSSHYMVLLACDNNEMVYVSNPNGLDNTSKSSGWYDISEITPYLAKALFVTY